MPSWHSYPKIYNLGHPEIGSLFLDPVLVEEKVDGSQFSFGVFDGEIKIRSKGQQMEPDAPEGMFLEAVATVKRLASELRDGWTYRGEYLKKPKHNHAAYARIPKDHIIIFDINTDEECYLPRADKEAEAQRLGLEIVPVLFSGIVADAAQFNNLLETDSILGGAKIEGVVIKNYARFGRDKKALMGKHVSDAFREGQRKSWAESNPTRSDLIAHIGASLRNEARWRKSVQHLREAGRIEDSPRDIGALIMEAKRDIAEECEAEIKEALFKFALPQITRMATNGLPEWYKAQLVEKQFAEPVGA